MGRSYLQIATGIFVFILTVGQLFSASVVVSWDPNTESDLSGYKVYYGNSSRNYTVVIDVGNVTSYTIDNLQEGLTYYFAVTAYDFSGNESAFSEEVSISLTGGNSDTNPPELISVVVMGETQLDVIFSEPVEKASAENPANYSINNGVTVLGAILDQDTTTVHLLTTKHQKGLTYVLTVSNVKDLAQNSIPSGSSINYTIPNTSGDTKPPELVVVQVINETTLDVIFNEPLEKASAENKDNYAISDGVQVLNAKLNSNQSVVRLNTTQHQKGATYTLTVNNIRDASPNKNVIQPNTQTTYTVPSDANQDTDPPEAVLAIIRDETHVDVIFNEALEKSSAENIANYAIDNGVQVLQARLDSNKVVVKLLTTAHQRNVNYTLTINNVRDLAANTIAANTKLTYLLEGNNDENSDTTPPQLLAIQVNGSTQIDVNFSEPVERASAENKDNYSITPGIQVLGALLDANQSTVHLVTTQHQNGVEYTLTVRNIRDQATNPNVLTSASMNYKFEGDGTDDRGGNPGGQTPKSFVLFQNYPNPFNPETEIRFYLDKTRKVAVKIYNTRGQLVKTLVHGSLPAGFHTLLWNGTNNQGQSVPSGVYIYTLEVTREVNNNGVLLNLALERRVMKMTLIR